MKTLLTSVTLATVITGGFSLPLLAKDSPNSIKSIDLETKSITISKNDETLIADDVTYSCEVLGNDVRIRKTPSLNGTVIGSLNKSEMRIQVVSFSRNREWAQLAEGGWVSAKHLECVVH